MLDRVTVVPELMDTRTSQHLSQTVADCYETLRTFTNPCQFVLDADSAATLMVTAPGPVVTVTGVAAAAPPEPVL